MCVCVFVHMCGFCNVWVCVCVGFVTYVCFDNCVGVLVICLLVFTVFCIVFNVFFLLLCLFILICFVCKDYCHRVKTELQ